MKSRSIDSILGIISPLLGVDTSSIADESAACDKLTSVTVQAGEVDPENKKVIKPCPHSQPVIPPL